MSNPYTTQVITNYNTSPPADDASAVASNQLFWSKHKDKLADPIKVLAEAINTEALSAFGVVARFDQANTFTADQTIVSTDPGPASNPIVTLFRDSVSPAIGDATGVVRYRGRNSAAATLTYAQSSVAIIDPATGVEQGRLSQQILLNGVLTSVLVLEKGARIGNPTGGDKGAGTLNVASGIFDDGVQLTAGGQLVNIQTFTASGTWTPTAGTVDVVVEVRGSGGGGGGGDGTAGLSGAGGGGGQGGRSVGRFLAAVLGATEAVTVGNGGTGGVGAGGAAGGAGGTVSFGGPVLIQATGGAGGGGSGTSGNGANGGGGGLGSLGDLNVNGQGGGASFSAVTDAMSGIGGGEGGGAGVFRAAAQALGAAGTDGGGGSGGVSNASTSANGGAGGKGYVIVYEYS